MRFDGADACLLLGFLMIVFGIWMIYRPLAVIVAGAGLIFQAIALDRTRH